MSSGTPRRPGDEPDEPQQDEAGPATDGTPDEATEHGDGASATEDVDPHGDDVEPETDGPDEEAGDDVEDPAEDPLPEEDLPSPPDVTADDSDRDGTADEPETEPEVVDAPPTERAADEDAEPDGTHAPVAPGTAEPAPEDDDRAGRRDDTHDDTEPDPDGEPVRPAADEQAAAASAGTPAEGGPTSGWRRLGAALRPRAARSQILAGVLCAALGFALVVQVQQSASDQLSSARQEDLVRLLDEVTNRAEQLSAEVAGLEDTRDDLESGSGQAQSALELAQQRAESEGILSGRLPAEGPGVRIEIADPGGVLEAAQLFNVLEELRNAGAEVVEVNGVRLVTSTWFRDEDGAIVVDDEPLESPYVWTVIGDPQTMDRALEIPGGALATVRTAGAEATTTTRDRVEITAVREPAEPQFATPQEPTE